MRARLLLPTILLLLAGRAEAADTMRFWNLTGETIRNLTLAPTGTTKFGPNQCVNDKDGEVDNDERLRLIGVTPGQYDVRVVFKKGRTCTAHNVTVRGEGKFAFSLEPRDVKDCK